MFGFLKPKPAPEGPVEFTFDVLIEKPVEDVYPLIDWADPRNAKRALGNDVRPIEGEPAGFAMALNGLPEHLFAMTVTDVSPNSCYGFTTEISPIIGRLATSHEMYSFEPAGEESCRVTLVLTANFIDRMRMREFEQELMKMTLACRSALAKLKLHAEQGLEAAKAVEGNLIA